MNLLFKDSLEKLRIIEGLVSVTSVLSVLEDPPRIREWKERVGFEESERVLTKARERGTVIHSHITDDLVRNFNFIYKPDKLDSLGQMTGEIIPYYNGFQTFINRYRGNFQPYAAEITLMCKSLGVCGKPDCVGFFEGKRTIIDWKTSSSSRLDDEVANKYLLQLIGYAFMWNLAHPMERVEQLLIVPFTKSRKSGLGELVLVKTPDELKRLFAHFEQVLNYFNDVYKYADKNKIIISEEQPTNPIIC